MNPDTTDIILIFAFVLCVLVLAFVSAIHTACRAAYFVGVRHGILREKRRRCRVEERVREKIDQAAREDAELWGTEIDV